MKYRVFKGFFLKNLDYHLIDSSKKEELFFNRSKAVFSRRIGVWDSQFESDNYFIICDDKRDLDSYKSAHRNRIKRFSKHFRISKVSKDTFLKDSVALYDLKPHRVFSVKIPLRKLISRPGKHEYVVVYEVISGETAGFCDLVIGEKSVEFSVVRFGGSNVVDWGLIHYLNSEYVKNGHYLVNGFKSYFHGNSFQDKLLKYFGYRKCYVELEYKSKIPKGLLRILVNTLATKSIKLVLKPFI
jgi:hypothetical protein